MKLRNILVTIAASAAFFIGSAQAQWQTPNHSVPIGRGAGTGFNFATPGAAGLPLISNGASSDPSFQVLGTSAGVRQRLTGNADYYVRTDGNDSNTGTANTAGGAWLTIGHSLITIANNIDAAGQNIIIHVQGMGTSATYTENLLVPGWVGYGGSGFTQFIVQGENGTVTIQGASAQATVLAAIGGNATPIQFKNLTITNPNAGGIEVEADDGGFIALNGITLGATGAGGIQVTSVVSSGRILIMAGTLTISGGSGTGFRATQGSGIIFQGGVTINFSGTPAYTTAFASASGSGAFIDFITTTFGGTGATGPRYFIQYPAEIYWNASIDTLPGSTAGTASRFGVVLAGAAYNVNLNSGNTDTSINLGNPAVLISGTYILDKVLVVNNGTTASLTNATAGLFQAAGGAGLALAANQALSPITSNAVNGDANSLSLALTVGNRSAETVTPVFFRVGTAQGAAATANVYVWVRPLP